MATILCIDDEPKLLELYTAVLESNGYKVLTAPDGPTGIALTRKHSIDAVVLDFKMPDMDGNQVAHVLMNEQPTLPVVIWSECPEEIPESLKWFADALLYKGDGPDTLLPVLDKIVRGTTTGKKPPARTDRGAPIGQYCRPLSGGLRGTNSRP
jgi:two-component system, OmpR family, alkaline phosphatase synthesis response regulator PhoP